MFAQSKPNLAKASMEVRAWEVRPRLTVLSLFLYLLSMVATEKLLNTSQNS